MLHNACTSSARIRAFSLSAALAALLISLVSLVTSQVHARDVDEVENPRLSHAGSVTDESGLLGHGAAEIEERLEVLRQDVGAEVAWVILRTIGSRDPREFGTALLHHWGVGRKEHDDGVVVLHVLDRRRIEIVTGYGAEAALPDIKCSWLLQEIVVPAFRAGQLVRGHLALSRGIDRALRTPDISHADLIAAARESEVQPVAAPPAAAKARLSLSMPSKTAQRWFALLLAILAIAALCWRARVFVKAGTSPNGHMWELFVPCVVFLGLIILGGSFAEGQSVLPAIGLFTGCFAVASVCGVRDLYRSRQRIAPRPCTRCPRQLRWVEKAEATALLTRGPRAEQALGSMRFEVRRCDCGEVSVEGFERESKVQRCPDCNFRTLAPVQTLTLEPATEAATGKEEWIYECALCSRELRQTVVIPVVTRERPSRSHASSGDSASSDRSDSSSDDSSSSETFGGGDSGGGGAGASY